MKNLELEVLDTEGNLIASEGNVSNNHNIRNLGGLILHAEEAGRKLRFLCHFKARAWRKGSPYSGRVNQFFAYFEGSNVTISNLESEVEELLNEKAEKDEEFIFRGMNDSMLIEMVRAPDVSEQGLRKEGLGEQDLDKIQKGHDLVFKAPLNHAALLAKWILELEDRVSVEVSNDEGAFKGTNVSILVDNSLSKVRGPLDLDEKKSGKKMSDGGRDYGGQSNKEPSLSQENSLRTDYGSDKGAIEKAVEKALGLLKFG